LNFFKNKKIQKVKNFPFFSKSSENMKMKV